MESTELSSASSWLHWLSLIKYIGGTMVVIGVAAELLGDWFSEPLQKKLDDARKLEIAKLTTEGERLSKEAETARASIADANVRAAEAELPLAQLRRQVAPRLITQEQQNDLTASLSQFKGQRGTVTASPSTPESEWFARVLTAPLREAGWDMQLLPGTPTATILFPKGVVVKFPVDLAHFNPVAQNADAPAPADVLVKKLKEYGVDATATPGMLAAPNTIEVVISER